MTEPRLVAPMQRRALLKSLLAVGGLAAVPGLAAACSSSGAKSSSGTAVSFGSNASDPVPKSAYASVFAAAKAATGLDISVNTVDHNTFQQNITTYLQGNSQDVFTWFAGERMQFFAAQGLATPIDDVWTAVGSNYPTGMQAQSKGTDGHYYFLPFDTYPWAVFYRKSVFQANGYQVPTTWDQFIALANQMKTDKLIPIAFTDKDGWPAMGTFDYLNMRLNGYDFHISLMHGNEDWTNPKVKSVFAQWQQLVPFYSPGFLGLTWQEGAQQIVNKQAGMMVLGLDQIGTLFTGADDTDLGFFAFPDMGSGQDAVEAPIDGFMVSKSTKNKANAFKLLEFMAKASTQQLWLSADPADIATANGADATKYLSSQTAAGTFIAQAKNISQFMDRDTRPDFADPVMLPAIQQFLGFGTNPSGIDGLLKNIQSQKVSIWATKG